MSNILEFLSSSMSLCNNTNNEDYTTTALDVTQLSPREIDKLSKASLRNSQKITKVLEKIEHTTSQTIPQEIMNTVMDF